MANFMGLAKLSIFFIISTAIGSIVSGYALGAMTGMDATLVTIAAWVIPGFVSCYAYERYMRRFAGARV